MAKKPKAARLTVWQDAAEVPRAGIPDQVTLTRQRKRYMRLLWLWPLAGSLLVALFVSQANTRPEPSASSAIATSPGRATAQEALQTWLAQNPAPVPGASLLSWDGASPISVPPPEAGTTDQIAYSMEIDHFTLTTPSGQLYQAGVQVALSSQLGATVLGQPSLTPIAPGADATQWTGAQLWPGHESAAVPDPVKDAINAWAQAFCGKDPAQLRLVTGDPDPSHSYLPLLGAAQVTAQVTDAATLDPAGSPAAEGPDRMTERVELSIVWDGQQVPAGQDQPVPTVITYDVVTTGSATASPKVVAWGAPGTGPSLRDYATAVVGREIDADQLPTASASPDPQTDQPSAAPQAAGSPPAAASTTRAAQATAGQRQGIKTPGAAGATKGR